MLHKVDISANPISPAGAHEILVALSEYNDTLGDLGNLEQSSYMGVRIREELRQAIKLNNSSQDKRKAQMENKLGATKRKHPDASKEDDTQDKDVSSAAQAEYPLLKPIVFTNEVTDDYLDSGVWQLR